MFKSPPWTALTLIGLGLLSASLRAEPQKAAPAPAAAPAAPAAPSTEPSAAQRQQIQALRDKTERQLAPLREQLAARNKELSALWSAEPANRTAILQKESELAGLRQKMRQLLIEQRLSHHALLTPAQRSAWRTQHAGGKMGGMGMSCGCMQGGKEMGGGDMGGNMHGGMGNMHGGMDNLHGGMDKGPAAGMAMGMDDCLDCMGCMSCEGSACAAATAPPATAAPAAPARR
jgi:Spy/CpxP family protein refolding chaperone